MEFAQNGRITWYYFFRIGREVLVLCPPVSESTADKPVQETSIVEHRETKNESATKNKKSIELNNAKRHEHWCCRRS